MIEVIIKNPQTCEEEKFVINDEMALPLKRWIKQYGKNKK